MPDLNQHLEAIHATPTRLVIEFAGAGSQALAWLHSVGGSSRTILEATDRYSPASLIDLLGTEPDQFTSPAVARAMAEKAFLRAGRLVRPGTAVAGIGCTAAIATDRVKRGDHRVYVAACDAQGVTGYGLTLRKGVRSRAEEEALVSRLILRAAARACGLPDALPLNLRATESLETTVVPRSLLERLLAEEVDWVLQVPAGDLFSGRHLSEIALLSGAFNPLHRGHQQMAAAAAEMLGRTVYFELPVINADKAPIDLDEARRRSAQFVGQAPLLLSRAPLFSQKARMFRDSVFVLGIDTVIRLFQPRFYRDGRAGMARSLEAVRAAGCYFLVAGRVQDDRFLTLSQIEVPPPFADLFVQIPEWRFRADISSTEIRRRNRV